MLDPLSELSEDAVILDQTDLRATGTLDGMRTCSHYRNYLVLQRTDEYDCISEHSRCPDIEQLPAIGRPSYAGNTLLSVAPAFNGRRHNVLHLFCSSRSAPKVGECTCRALDVSASDDSRPSSTLGRMARSQV